MNWASFRRYLPLFIVTFLLLLLVALEPVSGQWLRFDRPAIDQWQWWRLLTAHWVHLSWVHALGNTLGFWLCAYIGGAEFNRRPVWCYLLFAMAFTGTGLYVIAPDLRYYVGLSGCLHGLLLVSLFHSRHYGHRAQWLFAAVIAAKVLWEQTPWYDDQALKSVIGGRVETRAHLLGFISAIIWLLSERLIASKKDHHG